MNSSCYVFCFICKAVAEVQVSRCYSAFLRHSQVKRGQQVIVDMIGRCDLSDSWNLLVIALMKWSAIMNDRAMVLFLYFDCS